MRKQFTPLEKKAYDKSNKISTVKGSIKKKTRDYYHKLLNQTSYKQKEIDTFYSLLAKDLKLNKLPLTLSNKPRRSYGRSQTYAFIRVKGTTPIQIVLYGKTAKKQQTVAIKTLLHSLIHEVMHQYDYEILGLISSFHTAGFYKRISDTISKLDK